MAHQDHRAEIVSKPPHHREQLLLGRGVDAVVDLDRRGGIKFGPDELPGAAGTTSW